MPTPLQVTLEGDVRQAWRNVVLAFSYCEGGRREEYSEGGYEGEKEGTRKGGGCGEGEEGAVKGRRGGGRRVRKKGGRKLNIRTANVQLCSPHTPVVL